MHPLLKRISIDPKVCIGKPCIRGTRPGVSLLLERIADRETEAELLADYPQSSSDDIRAAIACGAEMACERVIPITPLLAA